MTDHMIGTREERLAVGTNATKMFEGRRGCRRETAGARAESGNVAALGVADWLCLAATPTFAMMALLTSFLGEGSHVLCAAAQDGLWPSGMVPMYLLMSAFHSAPWLRLISSRRSGARRS